MKVQEVMTANPMCCKPDTSLEQAARWMVEYNCGALPVIEGDGRAQPIGIITDRDITCRIVAKGRNPLELKVSDCMSSPIVTVSRDADLRECELRMEEDKVRRMVVVDDDGNVCGIVAQADIAAKSSPDETAELVREISASQEMPAATH